MKRYIFLFACAAVLWSTIFLIIANYTPISGGQPAAATGKEKQMDKPADSSAYKTEEEAVLKFITEYMLCANGEVFTNIRPGSNGLETLSESVGLLMNYSISRKRKDLFDKEFEFLKKSLLTEGSYIRWKFGKTEVSSNAMIDDLRIAGALIDAYEIWQDKEYIETARNIQLVIYNKQVNGNNLYEFYDWRKNVSKKSIPLCYIDLYNIYRLSSFNKGWLKAADDGLEIINGGRITDSKGNVSPFFQKYYNYQTKRYIKDEEYSKSQGVCLVYTLYTGISLACFNEDTEFLTSWLKKETSRGKLYAWYNPETLNPSQEVESTAVYALAAIYAKKVGEPELYKRMIEKMSGFMVKDQASPYYGGFGDPRTGDFYSFDNLTALWALSLSGAE